MYPLKLSANFTGWKIFTARKADPAFLRFSEKVFTRDNYTCQFCGFQAKDFQEVVNLDQNYRNNKLDNLVTACCFCAQCNFIESVGVGDYGGGVLIYLPEIDQGKLNSLCHVLFCTIANDTPYSDTAEKMFRSLHFRNQIVEQRLGDGLSEPAMLGQLLLEADYLAADKITDTLQDLRLLPSRNRFRQQIEHWALTALAELEAANNVTNTDGA